MPFRFDMLLDEIGIDPATVRLLRHQPEVGGRSMLDIIRTDRPPSKRIRRSSPKLATAPMKVNRPGFVGGSNS